MNKTPENLNVQKRSYRVLLFGVIGLAVFSSAMRELNHVRAITHEAGELIASWSDALVPTASACNTEVVKNRNGAGEVQTVNQSDDFRWNGNIAPGLAIEVNGINGEIIAEPSSGAEVQVVAIKRSKRTDVNLVQMKVVQHAGGVTICALYPNEDGVYPSSCGRDDNKSENRRSGNNNIRNNDVRVDFTVKVPQGVGFVGRTINGEISATSLSGNVITSTINGSIKISTTGYAEASTINGQIAAKLGDGNWPKALSFKTINGEISLDLPANLSAAVDAQTLNGRINSDFPLHVSDLDGRKQVKGTIGSGGRDLVLRTLNGSINLRIAG
jgi:hypothetical protein